MNKANKQVGPLSLDELKQKGITRETPVWPRRHAELGTGKRYPRTTRVYRNSQPLHQRGAAHTDFICHSWAPSYSYSRVNLFLHLSPPVLTSTLMFRDLSPSSSGYWASPFPIL